MPDRITQQRSSQEAPQEPDQNHPPDAFGRGDHPEKKVAKPDQEKGGDDSKQDQKPQPGNSEDDKKKQGDPKDKKDQPPKKPFWKRPVLLSIMILVALSAIIAGIVLYVHGQHFESTDDAFIDGRISHIGPRVAGKVAELKVTDNQIVSAEQVLLVIDPAPFQVKLEQMVAAEGQAEAQLEQAKANLEVAKANAAQADQDVVVTKANALNAQNDFERFSKVPKQARSQQQLDTATANQQSTAAQVTASEKRRESVHAMITAAEKTRDAAAASVDAAKAQVDQARLDLSYTEVRAGHAGRVTRRTVEVGNYVSIGQEVLDIVPTDVPDGIWVTANFKETQLTHMEKNQPVTITIDAFPEDKLRGHIDSIQNGTGAVFSLLPSENATGNYVKVVQRVPVKIIIDEQPRHMLSPGMSVEPEVDVREHQQNGNANTTNAGGASTRAADQ